MAIYPRPKTSQPALAHRVCPYLLREVTRLQPSRY